MDWKVKNDGKKRGGFCTQEKICTSHSQHQWIAIHLWKSGKPRCMTVICARLYGLFRNWVSFKLQRQGQAKGTGKLLWQPELQGDASFEPVRRLRDSPGNRHYSGDRT